MEEGRPRMCRGREESTLDWGSGGLGINLALPFTGWVSLTIKI